MTGGDAAMKTGEKTSDFPLGCARQGDKKYSCDETVAKLGN